MKLSEAKKLQIGNVVYQVDAHNADGSARRWRVNGQVKTWKRNPERVKIPIKHGMFSHDYITENNLEAVELSDPVE